MMIQMELHQICVVYITFGFYMLMLLKNLFSQSKMYSSCPAHCLMN